MGLSATFDLPSKVYLTIISVLKFGINSLTSQHNKMSPPIATYNDFGGFTATKEVNGADLKPTQQDVSTNCHLQRLRRLYCHQRGERRRSQANTTRCLHQLPPTTTSAALLPPKR